MRRLPSLAALRAFEAAGRHLSLSKAAEELHVTPAAVSHQVKALEDALAAKLFRRVSRGLALTPAGQAMLTPLSDAFDRLQEAVGRVRRLEETRALTVSVAPTFGAKWLVPRLERLRQAHPELEVRIDANPRVVDLDREDIDVAIRFGPGGYASVHVERLMDDEIVPVCAPELLARGPALREPADLANHVLLHYEEPAGGHGYPDWNMWLLAAGAAGVDASHGPRFTVISMALQAALDGLGVALVGRAVAAQDIARGRLVQPLETSVPLRFGYWVICSQRLVDAPRVRAFIDWLKAEAQ